MYLDIIDIRLIVLKILLINFINKYEVFMYHTIKLNFYPSQCTGAKCKRLVIN